MKKILFLSLFCIIAMGLAAQTTFYIESTTAGAAVTDISLYEEVPSSGPWGTWENSTAKSAAPGLVGAGSRWSTNSSLDSYFLMKISAHGDFSAGTAYNIYITVPASSSVDAANSQYVIYDDANPEGSPIDSGTVELTGTGGGDGNGAAGNKWLLVAENVTLGAGATLKVSENSPQGNRFYSDGIKIMEYTTGPTPTPTPTPTPWPTPHVLTYDPIIVADDKPSGEFDDTFGLDPIVTAPPKFAWFNTSGGYNNDCWYRDNRVFETTPEDANATAVWTIKDVPAASYSVGYFVTDSDAFDNCYYSIECAATAVDELVVVSQNYTGDQWCLLKAGLSLSGDVVVTVYDLGRNANTVGSRMYADAIGLFPPPPTAVQYRWELYE